MKVKRGPGLTKYGPGGTIKLSVPRWPMAEGDVMKVKRGPGFSKYGPGVTIELTGDEVAIAIDAYLVAHEVHVDGPRTITVNGQLCSTGKVFVDPSGSVIANGQKFDGRGKQGDGQ